MFRTSILILFALLAALVSNAHASDIRTTIPDFGATLLIRDDQSIQLLDFDSSGTYRVTTNVSDSDCQDTQSINFETRLKIGVYPLADQPLSNSLYRANIGYGRWPKPANMPTLQSWSLVLTPANDDIKNAIVSAYYSDESNLKSRKRDLQETGFLDVAVMPDLACKVHNQEIQISGRAQIQFKYPDPEVIPLLNTDQVTTVAVHLQSLAPTNYVQASFEVARELDGLLGDSSKIDSTNFGAVVASLVDPSGKPKFLSSTDTANIASNLVQYKDRFVQKTFVTTNQLTKGEK